MLLSGFIAKDLKQQGRSTVHARTEANTSKLWLDSLHSDTTLPPQSFVSMELNYFHLWYQDH